MEQHHLTSEDVAELLCVELITVQAWLSVGQTRPIPDRQLKLLKRLATLVAKQDADDKDPEEGGEYSNSDIRFHSAWSKGELVSERFYKSSPSSPVRSRVMCYRFNP